MQPFAELPVIVINLDRSPERWAQMEHIWKPLVGELIRFPAVDGRAEPERVITEFTLDAMVTEGQGVDRVSDAYWRRTYGCYQSHLNAIQHAIGEGFERFVILEDDARPRFDITPTGGDSAEGVRIWGGALKGGSYTTHHRAYADMLDTARANEWNRIATKKNAWYRYQSTAVEYPDADAAWDWWQAIFNNPQSYDISWWHAMLKVPTFVPDVEVIYQDLELGSARRARDFQMLKQEGVPFHPWS